MGDFATPVWNTVKQSFPASIGNPYFRAWRAAVPFTVSTRGRQPCPQHLLVLGHKVVERLGQEPHHLALTDPHSDPVQSGSRQLDRHLSWACRAITKRGSSRPNQPMLPVANSTSTVLPNCVNQHSSHYWITSIESCKSHNRTASQPLRPNPTGTLLSIHLSITAFQSLLTPA